MKPQKAQHKYLADELKNPKWVGRKYLMMPKIDGWYGYYDIGSRTSISSNAQREIPSCAGKSNRLGEVLDELDVTNGRLIFELTVDGVPQFEIMNGILNRKALCPDIRLNVHDFISDKSKLTYERYTDASNIVTALDLSWIELVPSFGVSDNAAVWDMRAAAEVDKGGEGLILKAMDAGYSPGVRNADLMKIKEECEFDLLVTGMLAGASGTKYFNTLGALTVMDSTGRKFKVSGMTDADRHAWWANPRLIVGKVVKILCKNVMKDGSMREPRYKLIRWDKNKDDINEVK